MPDRYQDIFKILADLLPPAFGALIGLRNSGHMTPIQRLSGFACSFILSVYFGPAIAEVLHLGPRLTIAVAIIVAIIGMDVIGGLLALAQRFRTAPLETAAAVWDVIWKRK